MFSLLVSKTMRQNEFKSKLIIPTFLPTILHSEWISLRWRFHCRISFQKNSFGGIHAFPRLTTGHRPEDGAPVLEARTAGRVGTIADDGCVQEVPQLKVSPCSHLKAQDKTLTFNQLARNSLRPFQLNLWGWNWGSKVLAELYFS